MRDDESRRESERQQNQGRMDEQPGPRQLFPAPIEQESYAGAAT